jgi:hypothetical protein
MPITHTIEQEKKAIEITIRELKEALKYAPFDKVKDLETRIRVHESTVDRFKILLARGQQLTII